MEVSSPPSRPSPTGGLRPTLTPAPGTTPRQLSGGSRKQDHYKSSPHGIRGTPADASVPVTFTGQMKLIVGACCGHDASSSDAR